MGVPESITILPNDGYPDHGGDLNSVGLYQQRSPWWWTDGDRASIAVAMDPYGSTMLFLVRMAQNSPLWWQMDESTVCQRTQGSQFDGKTAIDPATGKPYPYAQNYLDRSAQTDALEADKLYFTNRGR